MFLALNIEGTEGTDLGFALEHLHQGDTFVTFYYNIMNDFYVIQELLHAWKLETEIKLSKQNSMAGHA